jgi:hypothetical protein
MRTAGSSDCGAPDQRAGARRRVGPDLTAGGEGRDHLLERLQHLRGILPVFAQELASARRQAASLRIENSRLTEEIRRLHQQKNDPHGE